MSTPRDYFGSGAAALFTASPWGIGVLTLQNGAWSSPVMAPTGTVLGGWRMDSSENHFGPTGFFDAGTNASIFVSSAWGIGFLKIVGASGFQSIAMAGNGTTLQGEEIGGDDYNFVDFTVDTTNLRTGPVGNFDGDGHRSVVAVGANAIATLGIANGAVVARTVIPFGTTESKGWQPTADDWFGPAADFDGDGKDEALVIGPWGIAIVRLCHTAQATLAMVANGTNVGGWTLNTSTDQFGPIADFDGDGDVECLIRNPNGFALLKLTGDTLTTVGSVPAGTWIGGWRTGGADKIGPAADFNGDGRAELLITSAWGIGVLQWNGTAWNAYGVTANGTACGSWRIDTLRDRLNVADDFDHDGRAELFVSSAWGIGLLDLSGAPTSKQAIANGTLLGGWRIDTVSNQLECGAAATSLILYFDDSAEPPDHKRGGWQDAVASTTAALRNRGTSVFTYQDPTAFINALKGFSASAGTGDKLFVYIGVHGSSNRIGPDTSTGPCDGHLLEATNGFLTLGDLSPSFRAIGHRGCDLIVVDGSCEGGETVLGATGQPYCAVATTGVNGPGLTGTPDPAKDLGPMSNPSVFGTWWTSQHDVASRLNGQILVDVANGNRIHQRMFRNDQTACTSQAMFGRGALTCTTTLTTWWWIGGGLYLYPILFPYEAAQITNPPVWTGVTETLLADAAGYYSPWQSLLDPYKSGVLDAAAADASIAASYAQNFNTIWQRAVDDPSWDPSTDSAKHQSDLGGIDVAQFTGTDGFERLVNHAYFNYLLTIALYEKQLAVIADIDAAVRASSTLKGKVPVTAAVAGPPMRMSDPRVSQLIALDEQITKAAATQAQTLTVTLQPWPPILSKPAPADIDKYLDAQLSRLTASSISQSTGDNTVDQLTAQLLATYQDQNTAMYQGSFLLNAIEDVVCAKQSAGLAITGDLTIF